MADPVSRELLFKRTLAQYLEDHGAGVYNDDGTAYTSGQRGIYTNGPTIPTTGDACIVLTSFKPISDGRANLIYRVQVFIRVKGNGIAAGNAAGLIADLIDHKENVPPGLDVSWAWSFSRLDIAADSNGRSAVAETFHFRGRR